MKLRIIQHWIPARGWENTELVSLPLNKALYIRIIEPDVPDEIALSIIEKSHEEVRQQLIAISNIIYKSEAPSPEPLKPQQEGE